MPTLTTVAEIQSLAGKETTVKKLLAALLQPVRQEQGCVDISLFVSHEDPGLFFLVAVWNDYMAWDEHISPPRQRALLEESKTTSLRELTAHWKTHLLDAITQ